MPQCWMRNVLRYCVKDVLVGTDVFPDALEPIPVAAGKGRLFVVDDAGEAGVED